MDSTITTRVSDEIKRELERITEKERLDRSAVVRRLLERAVQEYKLEEALERYRRREASLGGAAEHAGVSLRKILSELRERKIQFDYSMKSLKEDVSVFDE